MIYDYCDLCCCDLFANVHFSVNLQGEELVVGDVFYFDYGVVVIWGLSEAAEREVIRSLAGPALVDPLSPQEVEVDEFTFHYTANERPHIQNDTFTSMSVELSLFVSLDGGGGSSTGYCRHLYQSVSVCIYGNDTHALKQHPLLTTHSQLPAGSGSPLEAVYQQCAGAVYKAHGL